MIFWSRPLMQSKNTVTRVAPKQRLVRAQIAFDFSTIPFPYTWGSVVLFMSEGVSALALARHTNTQLSFGILPFIIITNTLSCLFRLSILDSYQPGLQA